MRFSIPPEELYWFKMTRQEPVKKKKFNAKEYSAEYYQKHKEYVKSKTYYNRDKMKNLLGFIVIALTLFSTCDVYPQNVTVKTTYTTPVSADSCYLLLWKGTNTSNNPLFEDGDIDLLNLNTLAVYKVPLGTNVNFSIQMLANGETFRIALVPFDVGFSAPLTVSDFYVLPKPPAKATIINVEIF